MSSKKQQFPIAIPNTGVRKDVDPIRQTAEMAEEGENCLFFDGVIRPRPGMTPEEFGTSDAQAWQQIYATGDKAGYYLTAYVQMDNGTIIANFVDAAGTGQVLSYSTDMGQSWQDTVHHPRAVVTNTFTRAMYIFGGYLFMFDLFWDTDTGDCEPDPALHTPTEYIYRGDLAAFPTSVNFTTLGPVEWDAYALGQQFMVDPTYCTVLLPEVADVQYDEVSGHLIAADKRTAGDTPCTWGLADALTTADWAADSYHIGGNASGVGVGGLNSSAPSFINKEWLIWGVASSVIGIPYAQITNTVAVTSCLYRSGSGEFEMGDEGAGFTAFNGLIGPGYTSWDTNISPHPNARLYEMTTPGVELKDTAQSECVIVLSAQLDESGNYAHDVWKLRFAHPDDPEPQLLSREFIETIGFEGEQLYPFWRMGNIADRLAFFLRDNDTELVRGVTSDDDGLTWKLTAQGGPDSELYYHANWVGNDVTKQHFFDNFIALPGGGEHDEWGRDEIWVSPTTGGGGIHGDTTTMFQMDMDDEDAVVVQGCTRSLLRLDRTNAVWDRIAADHSETVGSDPWVNSGDIPPLGASDDRAEYVSGTTIDGTYGTHPWVFRSFEAQGQTFLLGTNGQCRPICYHHSMAGGFARRMGEVPVGDPNDVNPWDADSWPAGYLRIGNLAPIARTLAVGANRVLLGNLPSVSPYAVEVSGFNDPDRGWGLEQFTLLGDTPGEIVSLNELSALSVAMYKTDAIYHAIAQTEFLGVAAPFRFELSKAGVPGPCSPASVLRNYDGKHIYLARDGGVYMYDGVAPIDAGRNVRRMIQGKIDLNFLGKTWGMVDTERKLVWFFYPTKSGLVNKGLVISTDQGYPWQVWPVSLPQGWDFAAGGVVFLEDDITIGDVGRLGDYAEETLGSFSSGNQEILMGTRSNTWYSQKWDDDGEYTDSNLPININLLGGWMTPGGAHRWTADELYHIFSSPDPEMELLVTLHAQQFGEEILKSSAVPLSAGRLRRRTRHRISGTQFRVGVAGPITRKFSWGGGVLTAKRSGDR